MKDSSSLDTVSGVANDVAKIRRDGVGMFGIFGR